MWQTILFDLDGTLTDSLAGITKSVAYALRAVGAPEMTEDELRRFGGPPLMYSFREYAGLGTEDAQRAVTAYRDFYSREGMYLNKPYESIPELLFALRKAGLTLGVVTSKETRTAIRVLQEFRIAGYFSVIMGCGADEVSPSKEELIERALRALGTRGIRQNTVVVGDRSYDMQGAKAAGVASIGVTYGCGAREELEESGADRIAENIGELGRILLETGRAPWQNGAGGSKRIWNLIAPLLIWFLISEGVQAVGGAVYAAIYAIIHQAELVGMPQQEMINQLMDHLYPLSMALNGVSYLVSIPVFYHIYRKDEQGRFGVKRTPLTEKRPGIVNALCALLLGVALCTLINTLVNITGIGEWMYETNPARYDILGSLPVWAELLLVGILGPIAEELLFRGILFRRMRDYNGYIFAAVFSAIVFGVVHFDLVTGISAFMIGVIMAMLYEYTGSIFTPICFHMGFNLFSSVLDLLFSADMTDSAAVRMVVILIAGSIAVTAAAFVIFLRRNRTGHLAEG